LEILRFIRSRGTALTALRPGRNLVGAAESRAAPRGRDQRRRGRPAPPPQCPRP
jgi:hypothetical protein